MKNADGPDCYGDECPTCQEKRSAGHFDELGHCVSASYEGAPLPEGPIRRLTVNGIEYMPVHLAQDEQAQARLEIMRLTERVGTLISDARERRCKRCRWWGSKRYDHSLDSRGCQRPLPGEPAGYVSTCGSEFGCVGWERREE